MLVIFQILTVEDGSTRLGDDRTPWIHKETLGGRLSFIVVGEHVLVNSFLKAGGGAIACAFVLVEVTENLKSAEIKSFKWMRRR